VAKTDEKVMAAVEEELKKNPEASLDELLEKAKAVNPSIEELTRRQFNARYPLQVKRRMSMEASEEKKEPTPKKKAKSAPRKRATRKAPSPSKAGVAASARRDKVRDTFLSFASDLAGAEERKELVQVLSRVDRYVDDVMDVLG